MTKKYIFVTNQFKTGGVETVFLNLAKQFSDLDIVLVPVHNNFDVNLLNSLPQNVHLEKNNFKIGRSPFSILKIIFVALATRKKLGSDLKDAVVINFSDTLTTLLFSFVLKPQNLISWIHCNPRALMLSKTYPLYWKLLKKCKKIVFLSESQKQLFYNLKPSQNLSISKSIVCTNFLDISRITKLSNASTPSKPVSKFFFTASRIDLRSKDYLTLIKGYSMLPSEIKRQYKLVIAGTGPDVSKVEAMVNDWALQDHVVFLGNVSNPYTYMKRCEIYIHASITEGMPMSIVEALACGCTVVASDCEVGPAEILENGKYGYLYEPKNANQLASQIIKALDRTDNSREYFTQRAQSISDLGIKQAKTFFRKGYMNDCFRDCRNV